MRREVKNSILMGAVGVSLFLNIIAINFFSHPTVKELTFAGWIMLGIGALLYVLSVILLRRKGVNSIVSSGIYGVIRHPMYLGVMAIFFSHIFFGQNWTVAASAIVAFCCCYLTVLSDEQRNIEKFGDDYKHYMRKVPRMNIMIGVVRLLLCREGEKKLEI